MAAEDPQHIAITVANPGRDRYVATWEPPRFPYSDGREALRQMQATRDPWPDLAMWESTHQTQQAIRDLCAQPYFLLWGVSGATEHDWWVATRRLYGTALTQDDPRVSDAVQLVTAAVRHAREYDQAAQHVSEGTRPTLHYYAAMMLARAVAIAVLGPAEFGPKIHHGLSVPWPNDPPVSVPWPAYIQWHRRGAFASFSRALRWDAWSSTDRSLPSPTFHILEALRRLGYAVGPGAQFWDDGMGGITRQRLLLMQQNPPLNPPYFHASHVAHAGNVTFFDVPDAVVELMVLYYFSILARYHPVVWARLLAGEDAQGYLFRRSASEIYRRFIRHVATQLTPPDPTAKYARPPVWVDKKPTFREVQEVFTVRGKTYGVGHPVYPGPTEWVEGPPLDGDAASHDPRPSH